MHLEAVIERVWGWTWRPESWEFRDALRALNCASVEIHLEAVSERVWRWTWGQSSSEIRGVQEGSQSWGGSSKVRRVGIWDSIQYLTCDCGNVENWIQHGLPRDETGWDQETVNHRMTQYAVYAVLLANSRSWYGKIYSNDLTLCS